jgi:alkylation response protein AidB-like acyl-CoA dehydrogenase
VGLRGTGSDQYSVDDLFVPAAFCVARDDASARHQPGLLYNFSSLQLYASGFAAVAMGIGRATIDAFVELARDKIPRGGKRTLRDDNVVQAQVAQSEARLRAARAHLYRALADITDRVAARGHLSLDERMKIRLAATFAIHEAMAIVDTLYHAAGATAIFAANPFERRLRDMHAVAQQLQGRQQHFQTVGQHLLGIAADTAWL